MGWDGVDGGSRGEEKSFNENQSCLLQLTSSSRITYSFLSLAFASSPLFSFFPFKAQKIRIGPLPPISVCHRLHTRGSTFPRSIERTTRKLAGLTKLRGLESRVKASSLPSAILCLRLTLKCVRRLAVNPVNGAIESKSSLGGRGRSSFWGPNLPKVVGTSPF